MPATFNALPAFLCNPIFLGKGRMANTMFFVFLIAKPPAEFRPTVFYLIYQYLLAVHATATVDNLTGNIRRQVGGKE